MKQISLSAKTYANSLIQTDLSSNIVLENLNLVNKTLQSSTDFLQTMLNPTVSANTKIEILNEIFKDNLDEKIKNFLYILIEKDRFSELEQIIDAYSSKIDEINGVQRIDVISAIELNDNQKQQVIEKLKIKLNKNIIPNWIINQDIIGGLVVKYDNNVIDSSLKTKLNMFSKK